MLSSGNPLYEKYYRQIDTVNGGRVGAAEAASFLKRSGLSDLVLGKIWDLADADGKGFLNKQEFFVALRLVGCAQNGLEVSLNSLHLAAPAPKFNDRNSPLPASGSAPIDVPWAVKLEEKAKYDIIFDSLNPVNGFLSGDKVKPVLLNSKLPVDVLGRVWDLSDTDRDGLLDRDEFAVAMYLVYRALEKEPVPFSLSPALVPPSKRKKASVPSSVPLIPSPPTSKESRQPLPPVGILPSKTPVVQAVKWVVTPTDKTTYDEIFIKTDKDQDGFVSGVEVKDFFLTTGLPPATLAHIWALCDTNDCGKLSKEQFALALHLINQKITKGIDPPQVLTAEMMPPDSAQKNGATLNTITDFSAIKELDSIHNEIADLHREKSSVEVEIKEKEEAIKQRTSEVQDLQDEVDKESTNLQKLQEQRQQVQQVLSGLDQQKNQLEEELNDIRQKCTEETQLISSLKTEISDQETQILSCEEELIKAQEELSRLHQETAELRERMEASQTQLVPVQNSLQASHHEINQAKSKLSELQESKESFNNQLNWRSLVQPALVNGGVEQYELNNSVSESTDHKENTERQSPLEKESIITETVVNKSIDESIPNTVEMKTEQAEIQQPSFAEKEDPFDLKATEYSNTIPDPNLDFFQTDPFTGSDPFKDDPFGKVDIADPFGGDPFKGTDPFADASDNFFQQSSSDPFTSTESDPFSATISNNNVESIETLKANDPFAPGGGTVSSTVETVTDPFVSMFGNDSFGSGFADFNTLSQSDHADPFSSAAGTDHNNDAFGKNGFTDEPTKIEEVPPALPPKVGTPTRPPPPPPGKRLSLVKSELSDSFKLNDPFHPFNSGNSFHKENHLDPFAPTSPSKDIGDNTNFANFNAYPSEEDQIEWAKRESERAEKERLARLNQQEQEDLELAIALSKSEISEA
ncbi:epidermal growth factor receptor substrate 15 isoform X2 [Carcharodon carcharias]|uniref:epidermal growth factor receptor substrate 15 isoform X2 n=1 Tax=Carcharodon carcharias TaxID=13397 RepID=UPI001B7E9384|nr:epidermal growth factor receptor substrate 15 isoform X2 [Carcharodon carcharias]